MNDSLTGMLVYRSIGTQNIWIGLANMTTADITNMVYAIPKWLFKTKPSLEDYIAAHNPTDVQHVEYLEKQYERFMFSENFWGTKL